VPAHRAFRGRAPAFVRAVLGVFDRFEGPIAALGVDYRHFRALLEARFTLDVRTKREGSASNLGAGLAVAAFGFLMMGVLTGMLILLVREPFWSQTAAQAVAITFLTVGMVAEFSGLLFDRSDAAVVLPAPVEDRTVLFARIAHALAYSSILIACLVVVPLVVGAVVFGPWLWVPVHLFCSLLCAALSVFLVVLLYMLTLRTVGVERFKSVVNWIQMLVIGGFYAAQFTLAPVLRDLSRTDFFDGRSPVLLAVPPAWFGGLYEVAGGGRDPISIALAALALIGPTLLLLCALRLARSRYLLSLASAPEGGARGRARAAGQSLFELLGRRLTRPGPERAGYHFFLALAAREHGFRLRVWPLIAMLAAMALGTILRDSEGDPMWWSFGLYALLPILPVVVQQAQFGENPEARWVLAAGPLAGTGSFLSGVRKATFAAFLLVPALLVYGLLVLVFGWKGLLHGALALEILVAGALALLRALQFEVPFSRTFRQTFGGANMGLFVLAVLLCFPLGGLQLALSANLAVMLAAIAGLPFAIAALWRRLATLPPGRAVAA